MYNIKDIITYVTKEGATMADALGHQLLLDLYSCNEESLSSAAAVQESVAAAFELADIELDEINYQVMDDEIVVLAIAKQFHFTYMRIRNWVM